ncbi:MAG: family 16 glycosylhydrolase [Bacilli bacterium]|nr:family 16 glycosylhydrolase [Bacilli bacterium]
MKKHIFSASFLALVGSLAVTGCSIVGPGGSEGGHEGESDDWYSGKEDIIADLTQGLASGFIPSGPWTNGGMFDCYWDQSNVAYDKGTKSLHLSITETKKGTYYAGEYRSMQAFSYGDFACSMKPISRPGVVSSFFTYTNRPRWDEIDIEFLGKDTTKVQFNYFTNGQGGHEYVYNLGFDASKEFHEYGFKWEEGRISWYVDGKRVYSATRDIPECAAQIMVNAWPGKSEGADNVVNWSGRFDGVFPVPDAEYRWIRYKAFAE